MALLVRARLSSLDDDAATASPLSSPAYSPPLSPAAAASSTPALAAPRVAAQLSSTEEDDLAEEVSNGIFFSVARVPVPPPPPSEGEGPSAVAVAVAVADGDGTDTEGSLDGSLLPLASGSFIGAHNGGEAAASDDDDEQGEQQAVDDAASQAPLVPVAEADGLGVLDALEDARVVTESLPVPSATEGEDARGEIHVPIPSAAGGDDAGAELHNHSRGPDAQSSTAKHDASPEYAAMGGVTSDGAQVRDNVEDPDSIADGGHDNKVDEEADGGHEASDGDLKSTPSTSCGNAVELLAKELEDNVPTSGGARFGVDDSDGAEIDGGDEYGEEMNGNGYEEGVNGKEAELFDYAALIELLRAASSSPEHGKAKVFPVESSEPRHLPPTAASNGRANVASAPVPEVTADPEKEMTDAEKKIYRKVDMARIKYLRLVHRLGYDTDHQVPVQVLYRLSLVEGFRRVRMTNHSSEIENAWKRALQHEAEGTEDLEFSCNVLVLGKTGVGKSATINSIFGEDRSKTNAFLPATSFVKEIRGVVDGVKFRVIDTPGLGTSAKDEKSNRKVLNAVKKHMNRCPPDIILYVDRLDTQREEANSLSLLRGITSVLGLSIWPKTIITLTHSGADPPEGPNGSAVNYDMLVTHRTHAIQQSIRQITNDPRIQNPVSLVENHHLCQRNTEGEKVLPDGLIWRRLLLLLCFSLKMIAEIDSLSTRRASSTSFLGRFFQVPPIPYFLSSLLQSREHPRRSNEHNVGSVDSDFDLDELLNGDQEDEEDDYDQLPPFKPLSKSQVAKLSKEQQKLYFDEYDYRTKLLQKKQLKEQLERFKEMKKKEGVDNDVPSDDDHPDDGYDTDRYPMPEWTLPSSFDSDDPVYRYRCLASTPNLLVRAVNNPDGWDHDCGFDGVSVQHSHDVAKKYPTSVWVQVNKDKREFTIHLDSSMSVKHGDYASSLAGFDIQTMMNQLAYTFRGETKFKNFKKNVTTGGLSMTLLGNTMVAGAKLQDKLLVGNRLTLSGNTGAVSMRGDAAYGVNLEATLREKSYPVGQGLATLGASLVKWRKEWSMAANLDSQVSVGRSSNMAVHIDVNNKLTGQVSIKANTSEQLNIALLGICSVIMYLWNKVHPGADPNAE